MEFVSEPAGLSHIPYFFQNCFFLSVCVDMDFPGSAVVKNPPANAGDSKRLGFDP